MRLLILSSFEYPKLDADSSYTLMRSFLASVLLRDEDLFIYWILPEHENPRAKQYSWKFNDLWEHPRVEKHFVPIVKERNLNEMIFGEELFELINPYNGKIPYWDAALCNNSGKAFHLLRLTDYMGSDMPPIFVWEFSPKLTKYTEVNSEMSQAAFMSNYGANAHPNCRTLFFSTWMKKRLLVGAREYLSSAAVRRIQENSVVFPASIDLDGVEKVKRRVGDKKFDKLTLYFGGRFTVQKRADLVSEVYDYLFRLGNDVDIVVTTPTVGNKRVGVVKKNACEIKFLEGMSQEDAWEVMLKSHVVMTAYKSFGFMPSAVLEQIASGLVVLVNDRHVDGALGVDYPFLYSGKAEGLALLKHVISDYPAAREKMRPAQQWVRDTYDLRVKAPMLIQLIRDEVDLRANRLFKKIQTRDMWGDLAETVSQMPQRDWVTVLAKAEEIIQTLKTIQYMPLMPGTRRTLWQLFKHLAIRLGDDCSQPTPTFGDSILRKS